MARRWIENDLKSVNRTKTPWLIVGVHRMFYCDSSDYRFNDDGDQTVAARMRASLEDLFNEYKVCMLDCIHQPELIQGLLVEVSGCKPPCHIWRRKIIAGTGRSACRHVPVLPLPKIKNATPLMSVFTGFAPGFVPNQARVVCMRNAFVHTYVCIRIAYLQQLFLPISAL